MKTAYQTSGRGCNVPPRPEYVEIYFLQCKKSKAAASDFFAYYSQRDWRSLRGEVIQDWKRLAWQWIWNRN